MTVDKAVGRKKVIVGIQLDARAKELLDWAVVKVADDGDSVVAIHVSRKSDGISEQKTFLDGCLEDYEGLCSKKQVVLSGHIMEGNSRRRVFLREAMKHNASAVIVGMSKQGFLSLKGGTSIAKYCAKMLPSTVQVMAIYNGKIIFCRGSTNSSFFSLQGPFLDPKPSLIMKDGLLMKYAQSDYAESELSRLSFDARHSNRTSNVEDGSPIIGKLLKNGFSSVPYPAEESTMNMPGWPLLLTANPLAKEARKMSVVQWVMTLPRRSSPDNSTSESDSPTSTGSSTVETSPRSDDVLETFLDLPDELEDILVRNPVRCRLFNYGVLRVCTSGFSPRNLIGIGGCNSVYKGTLPPDGRQVAVKITASSKESWKDFIREVDIMTSLAHERIAPLIGICVEDGVLISVYSFMPRGSLEANLHGEKRGDSVLPWEARFEIAVGIAEALDYLHRKCPKPVIHRDVKSSNILLTDDLKPQLSDLGLAIWGPLLMDRDVVGTFGYLAPEYFMYGHVSEKVDVYAFGVVLLELLSGRRAIGLESLVTWAKLRLEKGGGDYKSLLDPNLDAKSSGVDESEKQRMGLAASLCLTRAVRLRPKMRQVLNVLRGEKWEEEEEEEEDVEVDDDDEVYPNSCAESHLSVALLDMNDRDEIVEMMR
ncbi:hypothetical protein M569_08852 [Genlisea aurea]|uniref:Protein kinase domain-containing protein n=1 Tax=Genlisea aurea TaxID=192259 RepID=S8CMC9_9LAMI|nr:hypothetical protein M569_08852 [Genlisea aurea]